jgi:hypothetical protein
MKISDRNCIVLIKLVGVALLLVGVVSALLGPAETYVFQMFREGGRFHYEGFGFGSLMFGNIAIQIAGYYIVAVLCIPLGYGHLRLRWWARAAMTTLLIDWLIVGLPLSLIALMMLVTSKGVSPVGLPFVALGFILLYPVLPIVLLLLYRSQLVRRAFPVPESPSNWLSSTPEARKVATSLLLFLVITLHFPLLFGGFFPLFGQAVLGLPGVLMLDLAIITALVLTWGFAQSYYWSWWSAIVFLSLLTASSVVTFLTTSPSDILAEMPFAPREMEALSRIPVRGYHLALSVGMIPAATLVVVAVSRRGFTAGTRSSNAV